MVGKGSCEERGLVRLGEVDFTAVSLMELSISLGICTYYRYQEYIHYISRISSPYQSTI
jgi:hypothetical protein